MGPYDRNNVYNWGVCSLHSSNLAKWSFSNEPSTGIEKYLGLGSSILS